jgi:hypothetical protein
VFGVSPFGGLFAIALDLAVQIGDLRLLLHMQRGIMDYMER